MYKFELYPESLESKAIGVHTFTIDSRYDFSKAKLIGKGSFGLVCRAFDTIRKENVAIKRIRPYNVHYSDALSVLREIRLLKVVSNHPNVSSSAILK
jgi:serine/threonine protein kinase